MRLRTIVAAALAACVMALSAGASARAAVFCVPAHGAQCAGTDEPTIQDAIQAASQNNSPNPTPDTILVAPGTYHGPFLDSAGNPVFLIGSGDATILDYPSGPSNSTTLTASEGETTVSSVKVLPAPGGPQTALFGTAKFSHVTVVEAPGNSGVTGAVIYGAFDQGSVTLTDPTSVGVVDVGAVTRSRLTAASLGLNAYGQATAANDLIRVTAADGTAVRVGRYNTPASLTGHQLTLVGPNTSGATGVDAEGTIVAFFGFENPASASLDGVLIQGFGTDLEANGESSSFCGSYPNDYQCSGPASITADYSDFDTHKISHNADGTVSVGQGNLTADPQFVGAAAGNFDLRRGSPVVDRGEPQYAGPGEPSTDVLGRPRSVDGDADGTARVDIGAFERQLGVPVAVVRGPTRGTSGRALRFDGSSSRDPEGGTLTYGWTFGDGGVASSTRPVHTYGHAGTYRVRLSVKSSSVATPGTAEVRIVISPPCVVPYLRSRTLASARRALSRAHCRLGHVSRRHSAHVARGRVISSSPGRHRRLSSGARVAVVLSRGR